MTKTVEKITLSASRDIPFNKLVLSQSNVRHVKAGISIEQLAESIAMRTLLQSLSVRALLDGEGQETGMYEVPAGGRRFRALELLVKQKRLAKTAPVPCVIRVDGIAEDDSLAENDERIGLHPLDQFRAFQSLRDKGLGDEEIAARHFVTPSIVKQRLRLAAVSPKLLEIYAEDGMTLELLMAFTVTADHARQEQVWDGLGRSYKEPYAVRRQLTEGAVRASDRRARFVGLEVYEGAGGTVLRDLFQSDDGGWLEDVALLDKLVGNKLKLDAEAVAAEGWKWIEVAVDFPYGHDRDMRRLEGVPADLTVDEQTAIETLKAEYANIEAQFEGADELPDEVDERLGEIETALAVFDDRPVIYDSAEIARAGVFVSIDGDGTLSVDRGLVRPEDEAPITAEGEGTADNEGETSEGSESSALIVQRVVITIGGQAEPEDDEDDGIKPLPDRLVSELTAHRTLALRDALAGNPHVALTALLHKLVLDTFQHSSSGGGCLEVSVRHVFFPVQTADLKDSASAAAIAARQDDWKSDLPTEEGALWDWIAALDDPSRSALLAHCVSYGVNALYEKVDRYGGAGLSQQGLERRLKQADRLARAVGLDMVGAGWQPTVDNYLGKVTKARILQAVREAKGEQPGQLIDHLKKPEMAKEAEYLLTGEGWLPEPLRTPAASTGTIDQVESDAQIAADGEETATGDGETAMADPEPAAEDDPAATEFAAVAAE